MRATIVSKTPSPQFQRGRSLRVQVVSCFESNETEKKNRGARFKQPSEQAKTKEKRKNRSDGSSETLRSENSALFDYQVSATDLG